MNTRIALWSFLGLFVLFTVWYFWPDPVIEQEVGVLCPDEPIQGPQSEKNPWLHDDFMITPLASYDIRARILSRKEYGSGTESDLSPVDFALGWGRMSDSFVLDKLDISQGHRWYKWRVNDLMPIPRDEIERSSANVHILPATDEVEDLVDDAHEGNVVHMTGYLVKVTKDGNWAWVSSTRRDDTGDGACEVFWVESMSIEH
ncbi:MAG: hypothetical protein C0600_06825 [Ignavibacteria bacterium]|nr:MAG: hypothetical protein C0600_06825 [Ignavibacteria bacterium]